MTGLTHTPRYRKIVQLAESLAQDMGHDYVGVEHLLLAIIDEDDSLATQAMRQARARDSVRDELNALMSSPDYVAASTLLSNRPD